MVNKTDNVGNKESYTLALEIIREHQGDIWRVCAEKIATGEKCFLPAYSEVGDNREVVIVWEDETNTDCDENGEKELTIKEFNNKFKIIGWE